MAIAEMQEHLPEFLQYVIQIRVVYYEERDGTYKASLQSTLLSWQLTDQLHKEVNHHWLPIVI